MQNKDKEIDFVARHYQRGFFNADKGWARLGIATHINWRRLRVAAAIATLVVVSAAAMVAYHYYSAEAPELPQPQQTDDSASPTTVVKVIDFENTSLPMVVSRIEAVYGVNVTNMPDDADTYSLSLHYQGNAIDLVDTINDILGTEMQVEP